MVSIAVEKKRGRLCHMGSQRSPITQHTTVPELEAERIPVVGQAAPGALAIVAKR